MEEMVSRDTYKKVKKMDREKMNKFLNDLVKIKRVKEKVNCEACVDETNTRLSENITNMLKDDFEFTIEELGRFETIFNGGVEDEDKN